MNQSSFSKSNGATLVELMISMGLGVILMATCIQTFLTTKQVFLKQNALARIQENARVISVLLGDAIASSGSLGCHAFTEGNVITISDDIPSRDFYLIPRSRVFGSKAQELFNNPLVSDLARKRLKTNSDVFILKTMLSPYPIQNIVPEQNSIVVSHQENIKPGQVMVLSDCQKSLITKVANLQHQKGKTIITISSPLSQLNIPPFDKSAMIGNLSSSLYYIGDTGRVNSHGSKVEALYVTDLNGRTLELVEGAEQMKVEYGFLHENNLQYVSAERVVDWHAIVKVKVSLLLTSLEEVLVFSSQAAKISSKTDNLLRMWWHYEWAIEGNA